MRQRHTGGEASFRVGRRPTPPPPRRPEEFGLTEVELLRTRFLVRFVPPLVAGASAVGTTIALACIAAVYPLGVGAIMRSIVAVTALSTGATLVLIGLLPCAPRWLPGPLQLARKALDYRRAMSAQAALWRASHAYCWRAFDRIALRCALIELFADLGYSLLSYSASPGGVEHLVLRYRGRRTILTYDTRDAAHRASPERLLPAVARVMRCKRAEVGIVFSRADAGLEGSVTVVARGGIGPIILADLSTIRRMEERLAERRVDLACAVLDHDVRRGALACRAP